MKRTEFKSNKDRFWYQLSVKKKKLFTEMVTVFGAKVVRIEFTDRKHLWRVNQ